MQVAKLMEHQRAADAAYIELRNKKSGRWHLESKMHSRLRIISGTAAGKVLASSQVSERDFGVILAHVMVHDTGHQLSLLLTTEARLAVIVATGPVNCQIHPSDVGCTHHHKRPVCPCVPTCRVA